MNIPSEPRIFTRLPIGRQAIVLLEGQEPFSAEIINLALRHFMWVARLAWARY